MSRTHNLLCVDWDSFFDNPMDGGAHGDGARNPFMFDWNHSEAPFFTHTIWPTRAAAFLANGFKLPGTTGQEREFWNRPWRFARNAQLFVADSNARAVDRQVVNERVGYQSVWLYDAHHDSGYGGVEQFTRLNEILRTGLWDCGMWMLLYWAMGTQLHVRYPSWKIHAFEIEREPAIPFVERCFDDGSVPEVVFDRVFICRSGAWVPPWNQLDAAFLAFVDECPVRRRNVLEDLSPRVFEITPESDLLFTWHQGKYAQLTSAREPVINPNDWSERIAKVSNP